MEISILEKTKCAIFEPHFLFGNLKLGNKVHTGIKFKQQYDLCKSNGWKHCGLYVVTSPLYLVTDLEYVKNILTKDFQYFTDRGGFYNEKVDPLSAHLFNIGGQKWRSLRTKVTPTFTSGKIKAMFSTLLDCEPYLRQKVNKDIGNNQAIDIKDLLGCFTTDIIGNCAFGLECNSIQDEDSPFRKYGKKIFDGTKSQTLKRLISTISPWFAKAIRISFMPEDVAIFFRKTVKDTVEYREKNSFSRKDFLQLLIELKNKNFSNDESNNLDKKTLTMEEITAHCFVFSLLVLKHHPPQCLSHFMNLLDI